MSQTISDPSRPFTTIIFCHLINDEEFTVSAACRLQCEVSPKAFAFAVSQQQGASPIKVTFADAVQMTYGGVELIRFDG